MHHDDWHDPGGPEPADDQDWSWDEESLAMSEYVGMKLYLDLRDRFRSLRIPSAHHHRVMIEMIHTHDLEEPDHISTMIMCRIHDVPVMEVVGGDRVGPIVDH